MSVLGVVLVLSVSVLAAAEYSVVDYGARPDGRTDSARAFLAAWAAACNDTGAATAPVMRVPAGRFLVSQAYFKGPCRSAGVVLALDGTVLAPPAVDNTSWIMFHYADGLAIRGGTLDGQGQAYWACKTAGRRCPPGTTSLDISQSKNVSVKRLTLRNSKNKHMSIYGSTGVRLRGVKIVAPADSPNTDGIYVQLSSYVSILSATVRTGDDCVSMGPGTSDVLIRNIKCGPGHGISIGSLGKQGTRACVSNVTVRNAVIRHSDNGVRIKTWQGGSGSVSAVTFENVRMDAVRNPIIIDQYYCLSKSCENETTAVFVSGVSYAGIRGTYDVRSPPIHFGCSDTVPCTNITLSDVELLPASGDTVDDPFCWNVYGSTDAPTVPPVECLIEGVPKNDYNNSSLKCY